MNKSTKKAALALGSVMVLFATTLKAQDQPWSFGAKLGGSVSSLGGLQDLVSDKVAGADSKKEGVSGAYWGGGLTAGYAFHENVGIGVEVLYARLGSSLNVSQKLPSSATKAEIDANKPVKTEVYSHNLVVPVMLKWFPMGYDPEEGILAVDLGAQLVMPLSANIKRSKTSSSSSDDDKGVNSLEQVAGFEKSKQVNTFTVSGIVGFNYEFPEAGISLEGRYHYGLMDFFKSDNDAKEWRESNLDAKKDKNVRDHYVTVSLGYNFARLMAD